MGRRQREETVSLTASETEREIERAGVKITRKGKKLVKFDAEIPVDKNGHQSAKGLPCLFSGQQTITPKARFLPGFDAKLKSVLIRVLKGDAEISDIPTLARQWMQKEPLVGFRMEGDKLVRVA